jgi:RNA polymerase sigma-70 factor, ECF subfamily
LTDPERLRARIDCVMPSLAAPATDAASAAPAAASSRSRRDRASRAERRLARGLRQRSPDALEAVYAEYGGATFGLLLRILGHRGDAEDVQQVVFTEVWQRGRDFDPDRGGLLTWILTIARSRALDHRRRRVPEPRDPDRAIAHLDGATAGADTTDALVADARVGWLLRRLPTEEAEVLRLRFHDDRSQTEIAATLGLPLGTVKLRMTQALARLRDAIEREESV